MKRWIWLAAALLVMGCIFFLSAQPGAQSGALSRQVAQHMQDSGTAAVLIPAWFSANAYANVRKWAHVYIYFALGLSVMGATRSWSPKLSLFRQAALACAVCAGYAATDEIHQYFVPGRAMLLSDIGVDALGFLPGILLVALVAYLRTRRNRQAAA